MLCFCLLDFPLLFTAAYMTLTNKGPRLLIKSPPITRQRHLTMTSSAVFLSLHHVGVLTGAAPPPSCGPLL